jgi:dihydroorotase
VFIITKGGFMNIDLRFIQDSKLASLVKGYFSLNDITLPDGSYTVIPGLIDVHVHFREPGFFYKESIKTGSMASARGGYTSVCTMPNLKPVPDSLDNLKQQLDIIDKDAVIKVYPYGAITKGEQGVALADLNDLSKYVIGFSDDGRGVQDDDMMLLAMQTAKALNLPIVAHCEVNSLLNGGYIHDGDYAKAHNHKGICSKSEWAQIARDIELVKKTGVKYHVCHISTKESVEIIRQAKKDGVDVTCETAPHYLILSDKDLKEDGSYKMNPPLRGETDKKALIDGVLDGTIDMIATDHAPHSLEEKSKGLSGSVFGIVGIETAFQLMYTHFVKTGLMTMDKLLDLLVYNARKRFNIPDDYGFSVWDLDKEYIINANDFLSKGKATPFIGSKVYGVNHLTVVDGKIAYKK